jgi:hypothetical protein
MSRHTSTILSFCYECKADLPAPDDCTNLTGTHTPATLEQGIELVKEHLTNQHARWPYQFELVYVAHDDKLTDEGIAEYLSDEPDWDKVYDNEWEFEQRYDSAVKLIEEAVEAVGFDYHDLNADDQDELRFFVEELDTSDPLKDLLRGTPDQLLRYTIAPCSEYISGHEEDAHDRKVALVREALAPTGLTVTDKEAFDLVANGPWDLHEGVTLDLIWYGGVEDIPGATSFTITDPNILLIDRWNGSGFECKAKGTATFQITKEERVVLDRQTWGYGWEDIAGTHNPAYSADVVYHNSNEAGE